MLYACTLGRTARLISLPSDPLVGVRMAVPPGHQVPPLPSVVYTFELPFDLLSFALDAWWSPRAERQLGLGE